ncbi:inner membrane protein YpjD [Paenibacillus sp. GCM10012307]|uniref:Cytochrome c biogenesis protein CcsA n=1 Tax=Paenibacillus roseus TaxID=2798579 RepID=A0A934J4V7_9BACL|nr:cytochrome c biogenesis protein CcsA [Paenibacillus roseus]MBJ6362910.1 cytochrome c biogenesis protein CcsA [Paenibacillus roseus]
MITKNMLYDIMIYVYALSLLFYFSDVADASRRAKRIGTGLLIFVWLLQTGYLIFKLLLHIHSDVFTLFEYLFFFSWMLVTSSLVMSRFFRIEYLVFFINVIGFVVLVLNLISRPESFIPLATHDLALTLLYLHISLVICAYAVFTISAIFCCMYLFLHSRLKRKKWSVSVRRLPSLENIERYIFRTAIIGIPLLVLSLAVGVTSIIVEGKAFLLLDFKVFTSTVAVIFYFIYLFHRTMRQKPGYKTSVWNIAAFTILISNLFLNSLSRFHNWLS